MSKKFYVTRIDDNKLSPTYEEAEKKAKRSAADSGDDYLILESIAKAVSPVPQVEIVKI